VAIPYFRKRELKQHTFLGKEIDTGKRIINKKEGSAGRWKMGEEGGIGSVFWRNAEERGKNK